MVRKGGGVTVDCSVCWRDECCCSALHVAERPGASTGRRFAPIPTSPSWTWGTHVVSGSDLQEGSEGSGFVEAGCGVVVDEDAVEAAVGEDSSAQGVDFGWGFEPALGF